MRRGSDRLQRRQERFHVATKFLIVASDVKTKRETTEGWRVVRPSDAVKI
jgi:hypothetical protein